MWYRNRVVHWPREPGKVKEFLLKLRNYNAIDPLQYNDLEKSQKITWKSQRKLLEKVSKYGKSSSVGHLEKKQSNWNWIETDANVIKTNCPQQVPNAFGNFR